MKLWGSFFLLLIATQLFAVSAVDIMNQSWHSDKLFESQYQVGVNGSDSIKKSESSNFLVRKSTQPNSVNLYGLGEIHDGIYDLKDDTHVIFYTDGVSLKLDY